MPNKSPPGFISPSHLTHFQMEMMPRTIALLRYPCFPSWGAIRPSCGHPSTPLPLNSHRVWPQETICASNIEIRFLNANCMGFSVKTVQSRPTKHDQNRKYIIMMIESVSSRPLTEAQKLCPLKIAKVLKWTISTESIAQKGWSRLWQWKHKARNALLSSHVTLRSYYYQKPMIIFLWQIWQSLHCIQRIAFKSFTMVLVG